MRHSFLVVTAAFLLCLSASSLGAGAASNMTISKMMMDQNYDTKLFVKMTGTVSGKPSCAIHTSWDYVLDTSSQLGLQMYTLLVYAYNNDLPLTLLGTNNCDTFSGIESLRRIDLL